MELFLRYEYPDRHYSNCSPRTAVEVKVTSFPLKQKNMPPISNANITALS